jgi:hypothetical protein
MKESSSREDMLKNVLNFNEKIEESLLNCFKNPGKSIRLDIACTQFSQIWVAKALDSYYVNGNSVQAKQDFYLAAKFEILSLSKNKKRSLETTLPLFYALLSDNKYVISELSKEETQARLVNRNNPLKGDFDIHMWQLAVRNEDDKLKEKIIKQANSGRKTARTDAGSGQDLFSLLLKKDKSALKDLIQGRHSHIKGNGTILEDFMAYQASLETKLCWYRGVPVQIDSPAVPIEFMPVVPLDNYDNVYDFIEPEWLPSDRGLFRGLAKFFMKK